MKNYYDIVSIEKLYLNKDGDITIEAIIENMGPMTHPQTLYDPPEYAPCLCETTIWKECLPPGVELYDDPEYIEELINRHNLLLHQEWHPIPYDSSDDCSDDYEGTGARLFF